MIIIFGQLIALQAFNVLRDPFRYVSDWVFTMVVYEKIYLVYTQIINTFDTKIILHNYILY